MGERNEQAFERMLRSWEQGGPEHVLAMIRELFTDETVWVQPGLPTATGVDEAIAIASAWGDAVGGYDLDLRHLASVGDTVLAERLETFRHPDGSVLVELPVVGVAEFREGKIVNWREYYDTGIVPGLGG